MSEINTGGPAFPTFERGGNGLELTSIGLTVRDYFAAAAMQALISKSSGQDQTGGKAGVPKVAKYAYEYADAMLKAREQP